MSTDRPKSKARPVFIGVSIVAIAALAASVWFGIGWKDAAADRTTADTRDSALTGAQQAAINLTTVDSSNLNQSLDTMLTSVTGDDMTGFIEGVRTSFTEDQRDLSAKTISELTSGALTEFGADDGTATAVVVVSTTTTRSSAAPERQRATMKLSMKDVDGTWKAQQVTPIGDPVPLDPAQPAADPNVAPANPEAGDKPNTAPVDPNKTPADPSTAPTAGRDSAPSPDPAAGP